MSLLDKESVAYRKGFIEGIEEEKKRSVRVDKAELLECLEALVNAHGWDESANQFYCVSCNRYLHGEVEGHFDTCPVTKAQAIISKLKEEGK